MKKIIPVIVAFLFLVACGGRKEVGRIEEVPVVDSVLVKVDSVVADSMPVVEELPPRTADELFDDFIYAFMNGKRFQLSRISFPLKLKVDSIDSLLRRKHWEYTPLYANLDVYTMIFNHANEESIEKDTSVNNVFVDWIDLNTQRVKTFHFRRTQGFWKLSALEELAIDKASDHNFYTFYNAFVSDSLFQREHVSNNLKFLVYDEDSGEDIEGTLEVNQWYEFRPTLPTDVITNIIYGERPNDTDERILVLSSLSGGMNCKLHFKRVADAWMLIQFEN